MKTKRFLVFIPVLLSCGSTEPERRLPDSLPFEMTRADVGDPLTPSEVDTFTRRYRFLETKVFRLDVAHEPRRRRLDRQTRLCPSVERNRGRQKGDVVTMVHTEKHSGDGAQRLNDVARAARRRTGMC